MSRRIIGQVKDGKFAGGKPAEATNREHKGHKEFQRLHFREKYARDIEQRYTHGQVNPAYVEAFGKENAIREGLVEAPKYE